MKEYIENKGPKKHRFVRYRDLIKDGKLAYYLHGDEVRLGKWHKTNYYRDAYPIGQVCRELQEECTSVKS